MPRLSARFGWQAGFCFGADDGAGRTRRRQAGAGRGWGGARLAQVASSLQIVAAAEGGAVRRWGLSGKPGGGEFGAGKPRELR